MAADSTKFAERASTVRNVLFCCCCCSTAPNDARSSIVCRMCARLAISPRRESQTGTFNYFNLFLIYANVRSAACVSECAGAVCPMCNTSAFAVVHTHLALERRTTITSVDFVLLVRFFYRVPNTCAFNHFHTFIHRLRFAHS